MHILFSLDALDLWRDTTMLGLIERKRTLCMEICSRTEHWRSTAIPERRHSVTESVSRRKFSSSRPEQTADCQLTAAPWVYSSDTYLTYILQSVVNSSMAERAVHVKVRAVLRYDTRNCRALIRPSRRLQGEAERDGRAQRTNTDINNHCYHPRNQLITDMIYWMSFVLRVTWVFRPSGQILPPCCPPRSYLSLCVPRLRKPIHSKPLVHLTQLPDLSYYNNRGCSVFSNSLHCFVILSLSCESSLSCFLFLIWNDGQKGCCSQDGNRWEDNKHLLISLSALFFMALTLSLLSF